MAMSVCTCTESREPIADVVATRPPRLWRVEVRCANYSAFNGYAHTPSDYSQVRCLRCGNVWRTKAGYVNQLPDIADVERYVWSGYAVHAGVMRALGREPYSGQLR
jgi:hypothetical protein